MKQYHLVALIAYSKAKFIEETPFIDVFESAKDDACEAHITVEEFLENYLTELIQGIHYVGPDIVPVSRGMFIEEVLGWQLLNHLAYAYVDMMGFTGEMKLFKYSPWDVIEEFDL